MILRELTDRIHRGNVDWGLSEEDQDVLRLAWYRRSVRAVELIEERFMVERGMQEER